MIIANAALAGKYERLQSIIAPLKRVAVACSGGVDSTFLLKCAVETLGLDNVAAVLAVSPLLIDEEIEQAHRVINEVGCRPIAVTIDPFAWPEVSANPPDRCYHCKKKIYTIFKEKISAQDIHILMDGTNRDDLNDYRPGLKAVKELKVVTPLVDAQLGKSEIRHLSRELQLSNWNLPSSSCLATRIPSGRPITREQVTLVAGCENHLHDLGFKGCRVRLTNRDAVIELAEGDIKRFVTGDNRRLTEKKFFKFGLDRIFLNIREREAIAD